MLARRIVCLVALAVCAALLAGCSTSITYQGSYFANFGGIPMKAKLAQTGPTSSTVVFAGNTVRQVSIGTNAVPVDAAGRAMVTTNWPPNVYQVDAVVNTGFATGTSAPAVLTIVGPQEFYRGVFAGGLIKANNYISGGFERTTVCPRDITFGLQHPLVAQVQTNTTVFPTFILLDNDYPTGAIAITSVDFKAAALDDNDPSKVYVLTGQCYVSINAGSPVVKKFTATVCKLSGSTYQLQVIVREMHDDTVFYTLGPAVIQNGGAAIRAYSII